MSIDYPLATTPCWLYLIIFILSKHLMSICINHFRPFFPCNIKI